MYSTGKFREHCRFLETGKCCVLMANDQPIQGKPQSAAGDHNHIHNI